MNTRATALALLLCLSAPGCRTIQPVTPMLRAVQEYATPEPSRSDLSLEEAHAMGETLDRISPPGEQRAAKRAMRRWTERYLKQQYRVTSEHYVLLESGSTDGARVGSRVRQYIEQKRGGRLQVSGWINHDDGYRLILWRLSDPSPSYVALVTTYDFLPGTDDRALVGYFALDAVDPAQDN